MELHSLKLTTQIEYYIIVPVKWWEKCLDDGRRYRSRWYTRSERVIMLESPNIDNNITLPLLAEHNFYPGPYLLYSISYNIDSQDYCASISLKDRGDWLKCPIEEEASFVEALDQIMLDIGWKLNQE